MVNRVLNSIHHKDTKTLREQRKAEIMDDDNLTNEQWAGRCPRCAANLRAWSDLDEEEREVARRLPASAVYSQEEREDLHIWCVRCWHEETGGARREA